MVTWSSNWHPDSDWPSQATLFLNVLVVGHKRFADPCCDALRKAGHESYVSHTGVRGLMMAEKRRPEVILIDLALPDKDGIDLANAVRSTADLHEILLIGAYDNEHDQMAYQESLGVAFDHYLIKPIDLSQLADAIQAAWTLTRQGLASKRTHRGCQRRFGC